MRVLKRNAVLSSNGNRPILTDAVKSDVSKLGPTTELLSYGHSDLCNGHHFLLHISF